MPSIISSAFFIIRMIRHLDISASRIINQLISKISVLSSFLKIITHTSSGKIYPLYTIIIPFILESGFEIVRVGLIAFAFQVPVYLLSKNLIKRKRPSSHDGINPIIIPSIINGPRIKPCVAPTNCII